MKIAARACVCAVTALTLFNAANAFASPAAATANALATGIAAADSAAINRSPITTFGSHQLFDLTRSTKRTDMEARGEQERAATKPCAPGTAAACTPREWTQLI